MWGNGKHCLNNPVSYLEKRVDYWRYCAFRTVKTFRNNNKCLEITALWA